MAVKNGTVQRLLIAGVVDADVGTQETNQHGAQVVVAWASATTQRRLSVGNAAFLSGVKHVMKAVRPSPHTKGMMIAYLAPVA